MKNSIVYGIIRTLVLGVLIFLSGIISCMKRVTLVMALLLLPLIALAHVPVLPKFSSYEDAKVIERPTISHAYYAELRGFPHVYTFTLEKSEEVVVELLVPDIKNAKNDVGGIMLRQTGSDLMEEVTRFEPAAAEWNSYFEQFGGDSYRQGPAYRAELPAGEYLIEVNTPANLGKYVLVVGEAEDFSEVGFLTTMGRIYQVKRFFDKPPIAVLQSPFYYLPFGVVVIISLIFWYWQKRRHA